ncbi:MAG: hypothetical protein PHU80_01625 [Kiritimatiellae bacterium]|nr:hypothetical protein [Kiritimatiellia bacterium]
MELNLEQRQAVIDWVAKGASLSEVQKMLKEQFGISMTFMDVRLLVLEIGAELKDKPEPKAPAETPAAGQGAANDPYADEDEDYPDSETDAPLSDGAGTQVSLSLDRVMAPGAMVSGEVTFSDGVKARWLIDQYGRFGLEPAKPGYQPAAADLQAFQTQLRLELRRHGYG